MFIEIKKGLKSGLCVLIAVAVVVFGVEYLRNHSGVKKINEFASLGQRVKHLWGQKVLNGNNIHDFCKYVASGVCEAKLAGFKDEEIFGEYERDKIVKFYGKNGNLSEETLHRIKRKLENDIVTFCEKGYTVKEAKVAGFIDEKIFKVYKRDAIMEFYGDNGSLSNEILHRIKSVFEPCFCSCLDSFNSRGYTIEEAKRVGFSDDEIFAVYKRDKVVEFYGEHGELNDEILERIKEISLDSFSFDDFTSLGYSILEAKKAKFSDEEIFRMYKRDAIVEFYVNNGSLSDEILKKIKKSLGDNVQGFCCKGYTAAEAKRAKFSDEEIFIEYNCNAIVEDLK